MSELLQIGVSAGIDTVIFVYDLKDSTIRHRVEPTKYGGFTKLMFSTIQINTKAGDGKSIMLYAGSTLGDFFVIDVRSGEIVKQFKGHAAPINCFVEAK